MRRRLTLLIYLLVLMSLLLPTIVLAATYNIGVQLSSSATYGVSGWIASINNTWLATNGFILPTGLDTRVTDSGIEVPRMVCDSKTMFATDIAGNTTKNLIYSFDNTPSSSMDIVLGNGGYITVSDNITIEPESANFTVSWTGYVPSTAASLTSKDGAYRIQTNGSGNLTSDFGYSNTDLVPTGASGTSWTDPTNACDNNTATYARYTVLASSWSNYLTLTVGSALMNGIKYHVSADAQIDQLEIDVYYGGGWHNVQSGTFTSSAWVTKNMAATSNVIQMRMRFYNSAGAGNFYAYVYEAHFTEVVRLTSTYTVGLANVSLEADGTNAYLKQNGITLDSVALGGASTANNSNNWVISQGVPYTQSCNITVGGTLRARYQPNTMIIGTTLPDRETGDGVSNDGTITWGSNPAGTSVTLTSTSPITSGATASANQEVANLMPSSPGVNVPGSSGGTEGSSFPFYDVFKAWVDAYNSLSPRVPITMPYFWMIVGMIIVFIVIIIAGPMGAFIVLLAAASALVVECTRGIFDWKVLYIYLLLAVPVFIFRSKVHQV